MRSQKQTDKNYFYACVLLLVAMLICLIFQIVAIAAISASRTTDSAVLLPFDISLPLLFVLGITGVVVGVRALGLMKKPSAWSKSLNGWVFFVTICLGVFSALMTLLLLSPFLVS